MKDLLTPGERAALLDYLVARSALTREKLDDVIRQAEANVGPESWLWVRRAIWRDAAAKLKVQTDEIRRNASLLTCDSEHLRQYAELLGVSSA